MQWLEFQILPIAVERLYDGDLLFDDGGYVSLPTKSHNSHKGGNILWWILPYPAELLS